MKLRSIVIGAALLALSSGASADWHKASSKHFVIYSDDRPEKLREFAEKLEKFDAGVRLLRRMDDPPIGDGLRLTVYVLDDTNDVSRLAVGGSSNIAGFYVSRATGSAAFVPRKSGSVYRYGPDAETVFFHEYTHHLMYQGLSGRVPGWLSEGFAEFFSSPKFLENGVRLGTPAEHRAIGLSLLGRMKVEDLVGDTLDPRSGEESEILYGRGWLLLHYLTFEESRAGQLDEYLAAIGKGATPLNAAKSAFGDLRQLNRELDRYWRNNRFTHLDVQGPTLAANVASIRVRPLRPGEAAIMPLRIRSDRGVNEKTAPRVATDSRRIAAAYPNDPFVQAELAEAEYDAQNYPGAIAAANRAVAADPKNVDALLYEARSLMALAKDAPDKADWSAIRGLITRANRLDKENPEPLMLFYQSYGAAGKPATDNAIEGLLYAQLLAPFDAGLRLMTTTELLQRSDFAGARQMVQPLLMQPHSDEKRRDRIQLVLTAIDSRNKPAALAALASSEKADEAEEDGQ